MKDNAIIPIEHINAIEVFTGGGLDALLDKVRAATASLVPDVSTDSGRKEIASTAYKVARSKTAIDDAGKDLVAGWKKQAAVVDVERKRARDTLDSLRDEVRRPLTEWEEERAAEERAEQERIREAREAAERQQAEENERLRAENARLVAEQEARDRAEAERLDAEEAEKIRVQREAAIRKEESERVEREQREAVEQAKRDAEAAEARRVQEAKDAEERQQQAVAAAEQAAKRRAEEVERQRVAEANRIAAEQSARERDHAHRKAVNNKAADDFVAAGFTEAEAKRIVTAIASGNIAHTTIQY